ncbi:hypothetical protein GJAV_G00212950 [Gymnothorax javanicus]|nr:hypothetical protein GJAV_G00212950 [Gymnothorax javanicus]
MSTSSACFFGKLRNLAALLETETAKLQQAHENPADDGTEGGLRVLHELQTEVRDLRGQVQDQLTQYETEGRNVRKCMQMLLVLKQRTTEDIQRLTRHYEKYGYKAPSFTQNHSEPKSQEAEEGGTGTSEEEDENQLNCDKAKENSPRLTPAKIPPADRGDPMRTPRLSDFGLSELSMRKALSNMQRSVGEAPVAPRLTAASLTADLEPVLPKTPKCALPMDEEALTLHVKDFGILEHTMCLNNDFTMDLLRKKSADSCRTAASGDDLETFSREANSQYSPAPASETSSPEASGSLSTPEPPVLVTPGFKIKKPAPLTTPANNGLGHQPPLDPMDPPATPEIPVFETPHVQKLFTVTRPKHGDPSQAAAALERKPRPPEHLTSNRAPAISGSFDVPSLPVRPTQMDEHTPEMPNLESFLRNKFPSRTAETHGKPEKQEGGEQLTLQDHRPPVLDAHNICSQDFRLASPPTRSDYCDQPSTPEMPQLSCVTLDIFKSLSQDNTKPCAEVFPTSKPVAQPNSKPATSVLTSAGKENCRQQLALVTESQFLGLPGYLRQMSLASLNQAVQRINGALEDGHSRADADVDVDSPELLMEDLTWITGAGMKASVYILCLTELRRLEHVQGEGLTAVYRVLTSC